jgi:hypothetical protein
VYGKVNFYDNDEMPYRKKSKGKHIKKSNHKHRFEPCVFEYESKRFDRHKGYVPSTEVSLGSYCPICGKVSLSLSGEPGRWVSSTRHSAFWRNEYTEEAKRELNKETRTLPTFHLDDYFSQKYVEVN